MCAKRNGINNIATRAWVDLLLLLLFLLLRALRRFTTRFATSTINPTRIVKLMVAIARSIDRAVRASIVATGRNARIRKFIFLSPNCTRRLDSMLRELENRSCEWRHFAKGFDETGIIRNEGGYNAKVTSNFIIGPLAPFSLTLAATEEALLPSSMLATAIPTTEELANPDFFARFPGGPRSAWEACSIGILLRA
jgi:hypothetical protein